VKRSADGAPGRSVAAHDALEICLDGLNGERIGALENRLELSEGSDDRGY
jgi:hypothetical protein